MILSHHASFIIGPYPDIIDADVHLIVEEVRWITNQPTQPKNRFI